MIAFLTGIMNAVQALATQLTNAVTSINNNTNESVLAAVRTNGFVLVQSVNFFESRVWTVPEDGIVIIRAMGAGGSGARGTPATGGYSASWGAKLLRVKKGETITVNIGAGGVLAATNVVTQGVAGGNTTVTHLGVTRIAPGGPGGIGANNVAINPGNGPSPTAGHWDTWAASVRPGGSIATSGGATGGAGVDILGTGNNASRSQAISIPGTATGGGGTGGTSNGLVGGGAMPNGADANGLIPTAGGAFLDAGNGEWGISFYGGSGGAVVNASGGNGGGSATKSSNTTVRGGNGGGGGGSSTAGQIAAADGGLGGGGGGSGNSLSYTNAPGAGGDGFAHLKFFRLLGA